MIANNFRRTKRACQFSYFAMTSAFTLPPMLFVTFHQTYGISYTLLGSLVLVNFCTQFIVDLIFSFFSRYFNVKKCVVLMPLLTMLGMGLYALAPVLFANQVYIGLALGTVVFSVGAGLSEVFLSSVVAAIPGATARDMSMLHSLYAAGVVFTVGISSLFFWIFGRENWQYLAAFWAMVPIVSSALFAASPMPPMELSHAKGGKLSRRSKVGLALCAACIFLGAASENVMTNWISSFMENALSIPKAVGDVLGMAVFAVFLGLGRILHARFGKRTFRMLFVSMTGAVLCYLTAGLSGNVILSFVACILTGFATSMLWPGTLIYMEEKIAGVGVAAYALMAAGGDFGSSIAPQLMGVVVDRIGSGTWAGEMAVTLGTTPESISMKCGMLLSAVFPMLGVFLLLYMKKFFDNNRAV